MTTNEIIDIYGVKQIHELTPLNKLQGTEEIIIDDGEVTLRVTVDTLLGYIRDQINASIANSQSGGSGIPVVTESSCIHFIGEGEPDIPKESRIKGDYYIHVVRGNNAHLSTGLPRFIRVGSNMGLRMITN